jgi:hypothetical protein
MQIDRQLETHLSVLYQRSVRAKFALSIVGLEKQHDILDPRAPMAIARFS